MFKADITIDDKPGKADLLVDINNTNTINMMVIDIDDYSDLSTATITYDLKTTAGASVDTGSFTFDSSVRKKNKLYYLFKATLAHTVSLTENTKYYLDITLSYDSKQGKWENLRVNPIKRQMRA